VLKSGLERDSELMERTNIDLSNSRLIEYKILKIEDELKLSELKIIWRWLKNKIPQGLKDIISERRGRNL